MPEYADLEIGLSRREAEQYRVELRFSQPGTDADTWLVPPGASAVRFDFDRLRSLAVDAGAYGEVLRDTLFADSDARAGFARARSFAQSLHLPLHLRLFIGPDAPELHSLRWETLRDPDDGSRLFTNQWIFCSRFLGSRDWRPVTAHALADPSQVRALVAIANPRDLADYAPGGRRFMPLDIDGELARVRDALGGVFVTELASRGRATLDNLSDSLQEGYDILYLLCNGASLEGDTHLWLEDEAGESNVVAGRELVTRLREVQQQPRLVVLATGQTGGAGEGTGGEDGGTLVGLGPRLVEAGIPAALAMQGLVTLETVGQFMPVVFRELLRHGQIDRAVSVARGRIRDRSDWWVPVLYMGLKSGQLWQVVDSNSEYEALESEVSQAEPYDLGNIRTFLLRGFSEADLRSIGFENPSFKPAYDRLPESASKIALVDRLLAYAEENSALEALLSWAQSRNPRRYEIHLPYRGGDPQPGTRETEYDLARIRSLLTAGFTVQDLRRFCQDRSQFQPVLDSVPFNASSNQYADQLLTYAEQKVLLDELLAEVQSANPRQYARWEPFVSPPPEGAEREAGVSDADADTASASIGIEASEAIDATDGESGGEAAHAMDRELAVEGADEPPVAPEQLDGALAADQADLTVMPPWIFGMHDAGDWRDLFDQAGKTGWVMFNQVVDDKAAKTGNPEFSAWAEGGYGVLARLVHAPADPDGQGGGSIPSPDGYDDFAQRCAGFVRNSPGCRIWFIGFQMNHSWHWPNSEAIEPWQYADCFERVRRAIKSVQPDAWVIPSGLSPRQDPDMPHEDALDWFRSVLEKIEQMDGLDIHACFPLAEERGDAQAYAFDQFLAEIPSKWRDLPIFLTVATPPEPWPEPSDGWMQRTFAEVNRWNCNPGHQAIRALLPYRWQGTPLEGIARDWNLVDKPSYHEDLSQSLQYDYRWQVEPDHRFGPPLERAQAVERIQVVQSRPEDLSFDALINATDTDLGSGFLSGARLMAAEIASAVREGEGEGDSRSTRDWAGRRSWERREVWRIERALKPVALGQAVAINAIGLPARHIIHMSVREKGQKAGSESEADLAQGLEAALALADRLGDVRRLMVPSIAVAWPSRSADDSSVARVLLSKTLEYLQGGSRLEQITFPLPNRKGYEVYAAELEALRRAAGPEQVREVVDRGQAALADGDYEAARDSFQESYEAYEQLEDQEGMARSLLAMGQVARNGGDAEGALSLFGETIELEPDNAQAYLERGLAYDVLQEHERAITDYDRAIELDPEDPRAFYGRAGAYAARQEYQQALADLARAPEPLPEDEAARRMRRLAFEASRDGLRAQVEADEDLPGRLRARLDDLLGAAGKQASDDEWQGALGRLQEAHALLVRQVEEQAADLPQPEGERVTPATEDLPEESAPLKVRAEDRGGLAVRDKPQAGARRVATVPYGTALEVLEDPQESRAKIGVRGRWLHVRTPEGVEGYVEAEHVVRWDARLRQVTQALEAQDFGRALQIADAIEDPRLRTPALIWIAEALGWDDPEKMVEVAERALAAADTVERPFERASALARLANILHWTREDQRAASVAEQALRAAESVEAPGPRARALAMAAEPLGEVDPDRALEVVQQALSVAGAIEEPQVKAFALLAVFRALAWLGEEEDARKAAEQALAAAEEIEEEPARAAALARVALFLAWADADERAVEVAERALVVAESLDDARFKSSVEADAAWALLSAGSPEQAVAVVAAIPDAQLRSNVMAEVIQWLSETGEVPRMLDLAEAIDDAVVRDEIVANAAQVLAGRRGVGDALLPLDVVPMQAWEVEDEAASLAERAWALTEGIEDPSLKAQTLANVAQVLAQEKENESGATAAAEQALDAAVEIEDPELRGSVFLQVAQVLSGLGLTERTVEVVEQALPLADSIVAAQPRAYALSRAARLLSQAGQEPRAVTSAERALEIETAIEDPQARAALLADMAEILAGAGEHQRAVVAAEKASHVAETVEAPWTREGILHSAVGTLVRAGALERALQVADRFEDPWLKDSLVANVAQNLLELEEWDRALEVADRLADSQRKASVLGSVAQALTREGELDRAKEVAEKVADPQTKASVLGSMAQALAEAGESQRAGEAAGQALALSEEIGDAWVRDTVLPQVAPILAELEGPGRGWEAAKGIEARQLRADVFSPLVSGLPPETLIEALGDAAFGVRWAALYELHRRAEDEPGIQRLMGEAFARSDADLEPVRSLAEHPRVSTKVKNWLKPILASLEEAALPPQAEGEEEQALPEAGVEEGEGEDAALPEAVVEGEKEGDEAPSEAVGEAETAASPAAPVEGEEEKEEAAPPGALVEEGKVEEGVPPAARVEEEEEKAAATPSEAVLDEGEGEEAPSEPEEPTRAGPRKPVQDAFAAGPYVEPGADQPTVVVRQMIFQNLVEAADREQDTHTLAVFLAPSLSTLEAEDKRKQERGQQRAYHVLLRWLEEGRHGPQEHYFEGPLRLDLGNEPLGRLYGAALFEGLFHRYDPDRRDRLAKGEPGRQLLLDGYRRALERSRDLEHGVHLQLHIDTESPELHSYRWEYLWDPAVQGVGAVACDPGIPFSRVLHVSSRGDRRPLISRDAPLRILAAMASPADLNRDRSEDTDLPRLAPLDRTEILRLRDGLHEVGALVEPLVEGENLLLSPDHCVSLEALRQRLLEAKAQGQSFHVLHLLCHGWIRPADGRSYLVLHGHGSERAELVSEKSFSEMIDQFLPDLRLVVLASCKTALPTHEQPLQGIARRLVATGVPAVIAMQDEFHFDAAQYFSQRLYLQLGHHGLVDQAVNAARHELYDRRREYRNDKRAGRIDPRQWGVPVLFMRIPDGRLFDLAEGACDLSDPDAETRAVPYHEAPGSDPDRLVEDMFRSFAAQMQVQWNMTLPSRMDSLREAIEEARTGAEVEPIEEHPRLFAQTGQEGWRWALIQAAAKHREHAARRMVLFLRSLARSKIAELVGKGELANLDPATFAAQIWDGGYATIEGRNARDVVEGGAKGDYLRTTRAPIRANSARWRTYRRGFESETGATIPGPDRVTTTGNLTWASRWKGTRRAPLAEGGRPAEVDLERLLYGRGDTFKIFRDLTADADRQKVGLDERTASLLLHAVYPDRYVPYHHDLAQVVLSILRLRKEPRYDAGFAGYCHLAADLLADDDLGFEDMADVGYFLQRLAEEDPDKIELQEDQDYPPDLRLKLETVNLRPTDVDSGLVMRQNVLEQATAALNAKQHVILIGPPGTGKTTLAEDLCRHAHDLNCNRGHVLVTATADWTTFDTIGGYMPAEKGDKLVFRPGIFLEAIRAQKWLVIDEINRADIDKAFGELFTVLSGQAVTLPYKEDGLPVRILPPGHATSKETRDYVLHPSWRIIGTMNVYDKASLFAMSFAFMRRFAFVDVAVPPNAAFRELIRHFLESYGLPTSEHPVPRDLYNLFNRQDRENYLMCWRALGPAIALDVVRYLRHRAGGHDESVSPEHLAEALSRGHLAEALMLYVVPQFDGLEKGPILSIHGQLKHFFPQEEFPYECQALLGRIQELFPFIATAEWDRTGRRRKSQQDGGDGR